MEGPACLVRLFASPRAGESGGARRSRVKDRWGIPAKAGIQYMPLSAEGEAGGSSDR